MGLGFVLSPLRSPLSPSFSQAESLLYSPANRFTDGRGSFPSRAAALKNVLCSDNRMKKHSFCFDLRSQIMASNVFKANSASSLNDGSSEGASNGCLDCASPEGFEINSYTDKTCTDSERDTLVSDVRNWDDGSTLSSTILHHEVFADKKGLSESKATQTHQGRQASAAIGEPPCIVAGPVAAGVGIPMSLKMLQRKQGQMRSMALGLADVGNSMCKAFSSMVFMMKTLQSHTLHIRRQFFDQEIEGLLNQVQREMHSSLLWLFQQVFSCTPELMVLVMVLFADFTVYSMGSNLPLSAIQTPSPPIAIISALSEFTGNLEPVKETGIGSHAYLEESAIVSPPLKENGDAPAVGGGWVGNGGGKSFTSVVGGADGDPDSWEVRPTRAMYSVEDVLPSEFSSIAASVAFEEFGSNQAEPLSVSDFLPTGETESLSSTGSHDFEEPGSSQWKHSLDAFSREWGSATDPLLEKETLQCLVAPVQVHVEDDSYACYDRTDLAYQVAISTDSMNPLLLSNYAQFLFLVRKDHDRAEELFRRAVMSDPSDGNVICHFASFLWIARRNLVAAERAYREAINLDPSNSHNAANYAHFLWHLGL